MSKRFEPSPASTDIPLSGDASHLWTTDDAASELPALGVAGDNSAGEGSGDSLMHENSYV
jgi:hypothetical protein